VTHSRTFKRSIDSLEEIFAFTSETFANHQLDARLIPVVDLALEELFTNMVKYGKKGGAGVRLDLTRVAGGVEVTLTDPDAEFFDVTRSTEKDINLPIEQRTPGGLGLQLIRKMVDFIEYQYLEDSRTSRITFRKTTVDRRAPGKLRDKKMLGIDFGANGVVIIAGRLDAAQCPSAQSFLDRVEGPVTLDCTRLEYISSAGLGVLLKTQKRLLASAGKLRLVGVSRHLRDIFVYSGFDQIFEIEPATE
jgi:anti-anti-sigma factor